jgi:hypothetical protein
MESERDEIASALGLTQPFVQLVMGGIHSPFLLPGGQTQLPGIVCHNFTGAKG